eukprot:ANDGO_05356.mRNA.1 hypothetical protein
MKMLKAVCCVMVLVFCARVVVRGQSVSNAGVGVVVSQTFVDSVVDHFLPLVEKQIQNLPLPDVDTKQDGFELQFNGMTLSSAAVTSASVAIQASGVQVTVAGMTVHVQGQYAIHEDAIGHVKICGGSFGVDSGSTSLVVVVGITSDASGTPVVTAQSVSLNLGNWDINFCKALDVLLKLFHSVISDAVKKAVESAVPKAIDSIAAAAIAKIPFEYKISSELGLDFHLSQPPVFIQGVSMGFPSRAQIFDPSTKQVSPYAPSAIPMTLGASNDSMSSYVSSSIFQGGVWTYYQAGLLQHQIQGSGLFKDFDVSFAATSCPTFQVVANEGIAVVLAGNITLQDALFKDLAIDADFTLKTVGDVLTEQVNGTLRVYAEVPEVDVENMQFDLTINKHTFSVSLNLLAPVINDLLNQFLLKILNPRLQKDSFPIPNVKFASIESANIKPEDGYLYVGGDVVFH